jgi:uncharacterized protein (DUF934 family)
MSESEVKPQPRLWTEAGFVEDEWTHTESLADALAGNRGAILPLAGFLGLDDETRTSFCERIGVRLEPGEAIEAILPYLDTLPVVALAFPAFSDGRSYSKAALLRGRHGYRGHVRASGDVLIDQIPLMLRGGFDAFEVVNETALQRLEAGKIGGIGNAYQPATASEPQGAAYSWRRNAGSSSH